MSVSEMQPAKERDRRAVGVVVAAVVVLVVILGVRHDIASSCVQGYHWADANQTVVLQTASWDFGSDDTFTNVSGHCATNSNGPLSSCLYAEDQLQVQASDGSVTLHDGGTVFARGVAEASFLKINWVTDGGGTRTVTFNYQSCS